MKFNVGSAGLERRFDLTPGRARPSAIEAELGAEHSMSAFPNLAFEEERPT